jgi:hypothetical protein
LGAPAPVQLTGTDVPHPGVPGVTAVGAAKAPTVAFAVPDPPADQNAHASADTRHIARATAVRQQVGAVRLMVQGARVGLVAGARVPRRPPASSSDPRVSVR